jgi:hypothetical protein
VRGHSLISVETLDQATFEARLICNYADYPSGTLARISRRVREAVATPRKNTYGVSRPDQGASHDISL